jgi:hypothetical protein
MARAHTALASEGTVEELGDAGLHSGHAGITVRVLTIAAGR